MDQSYILFSMQKNVYMYIYILYFIAKWRRLHLFNQSRNILLY